MGIHFSIDMYTKDTLYIFASTFYAILHFLAHFHNTSFCRRTFEYLSACVRGEGVKTDA